MTGRCSFLKISKGTLAQEIFGKPIDPEKLERAKSYYYGLMGWDPHTGVPTPEKIEELDIPIN